MNAMTAPKGFVFFPEQLHWTAQELTEAVPLRLHEIYAFDAGVDSRGVAGAQSLSRPGFAPCPPLAERFSVR